MYKKSGIKLNEFKAISQEQDVKGEEQRIKERFRESLKRNWGSPKKDEKQTGVSQKPREATISRNTEEK